MGISSAGSAPTAAIGTMPNTGEIEPRPEATTGTATKVSLLGVATSSSTVLEQRIKEDAARGASGGGGDTKY